MTLRTTFATLGLSLALFGSAFAGQEIDASKDGKTMATETKRSWFPDDLPGQVTFGAAASQHMTGGFLDSISGIYATQDRDLYIFLDSKYRWEDTDQLTQSTGLVVRKLFPEQEVIVGLGGYYEGIHSERDHDYGGAIGSFELLTRWVDGRFNYYYPDNDINVATRYGLKTRESALEGFDAEVGFLIPGLDKYMEVRLFAGYFHFNNPFGKDFEGFKARLEARLLPGLIAGVEYWDDQHIMGGHWTGTLSVSVPFSLEALAHLRNPFEGWQDEFRPRQREFSERLGDMVVHAPRMRTYSEEL